MFLQQSRHILLHTLPMLVAQLISMGMPIIDTVLLGHFHTEDLAAAAVGGGIYIPCLLALAGILQAVAPIVAHHKGAEDDEGVYQTLQQAFWLALLLAIPGIIFLHHPDVMFHLAPIDPSIEAKARIYLRMLSWGVPGALLYRTLYVFCNALKQPKPLMFVSFGGTLLHSLLAWLLVTGYWGSAPLGVQGCGISNACVNFFMLACCFFYMSHNPILRPYRLFSRPQYRLNFKALRELLRMGVPMGLSNFVEVSSFTLSAVFVAQLGAVAVSGHRIVANLAAVGYMLPLAISIATVTQVGHAAGAKDWLRAKISAYAGISIAGSLAGLLSVLLWIFRVPLVEAYTRDNAVRHTALSLVLYVALYQVFDALQTVAAFSLRGYRITFIPMLIHILCFWGIGLAGGWWLAFGIAEPFGVKGFWISSLSSLIVASVLLGALLFKRTRVSDAAA